MKPLREIEGAPSPGLTGLGVLARRSSADLSGDLRFIAQAAWPTRLLELRGDGQDRRRIRLVDETRQRSGSFKYRGAALAVRNAGAGIVACGSGNFPIAAGEAAAQAGCPALVVMPDDAPMAKRRLAQASGADVRFAARSLFAQVAADEARARGWRLAHPFQSPEMLVGGCSLGLEIADAISASGGAGDAVVVACGGGGLAAGTVLGLRSKGLANTVYAVEPASHPRFAAAIRAGHPTEIAPSGRTICDALRSTRMGDLAFDVLALDVLALDVLESPRTVPLTATDDGVERAQARLLEAAELRAEPSGAIALAACLEGRIPAGHDQIWAVVCGGNV